MKKLIILFAVLGLLVGSQAFAHNVYDQEGTKVISTVADDLFNQSVATAINQANSKLPLFKAGTSITDEHGVVLSCEWFMFMGCQNPTKTEAYRNSMRNLARQLIARGWDRAFPIFDGWIAEVR